MNITKFKKSLAVAGALILATMSNTATANDQINKFVNSLIPNGSPIVTLISSDVFKFEARRSSGGGSFGRSNSVSKSSSSRNNSVSRSSSNESSSKSSSSSSNSSSSSKPSGSRWSFFGKKEQVKPNSQQQASYQKPSQSSSGTTIINNNNSGGGFDFFMGYLIGRMLTPTPAAAAPAVTQVSATQTSNVNQIPTNATASAFIADKVINIPTVKEPLRILEKRHNISDGSTVVASVEKKKM